MRSDFGFLTAPEDRENVAAAAKIYRDYCDKFELPVVSQFEGTLDDIAALEFLRYEGCEPPGAGIEQASLVCGEVLRRALGLEWIISYRGDWLVASADEEIPAIVICPLARLHEIECGASCGGEPYTRFMLQATWDCLILRGVAMEPMAREVFGRLDPHGSNLVRLETALQCLKRPERSTHKRKRC